jgi:hypothetical protein
MRGGIGNDRGGESIKSGASIMSPLLERVLSEIDQLGPEEQRLVMVHLTERVQEPVVKQKRKLSEFYGVAPNLLEGVDAQEWVNTLRGEWDDRETNLRQAE